MEALSRLFVDHPRRLLLVVTLVLIPLFSHFLIFPFEIESDVRRGFAQDGGRSTVEFKKFADFYNVSYEGFELWVVLVTAKRGTDETDLLITQELLDEVERLDEHVKNFTAPFGSGSVHFSDLEAAEINYLFRWYKKAFEAETFFGSAINLSFPVAEAFGHRLFLGSHFFKVNQHKPTERGPLERTKYIALWYMSEATDHQTKKKLEALQMGLFRESQLDNFSTKMSFWMYGDQVANAEMLRGTIHTIKLFTIGCVLMVMFMLFMFNYLTVKSQVMLTFAALLAPILAFTSCFAILGWTRVPFNSIMCITPFLVMGIGVDDAFLLVHCWRRRSLEASFRRRFAAVVREIGPSMLITSATNALAFGIGIFSPTPQMAGFCLCTSIAVMLDFVFEFLVFVPVMVMYYEEKNEKSKLETANPSFQWSWMSYTRLLISPLGRITVIVFTALLFVSATVGVRKLIPNFDPSKTFPNDSDLMLALRSFEEIQTEYYPVNFISRTVPSADDPEKLNRLMEVIDRLEKRSYCYGRERSQFILRDYMEAQEAKNLSLNYNGLPKYLEERMVAENTILRLKNESGSIEVDGINFMVVCKGSLDWNVRAARIDQTRQIIDEYPELHLSLFDYDSTIYDLIITVKNELIKAVLLTFMSMVVACGIFIPSFVGTSLAALSMLSISYSLLGWLSIWGQDLDPVTMINVLMAIGFSVDFSAHVCYHYHIGKNEPMAVEHRICHILASVGRPMVEASFSTLLSTPKYVKPRISIDGKQFLRGARQDKDDPSCAKLRAEYDQVCFSLPPSAALAETKAFCDAYVETCSNALKKNIFTNLEDSTTIAPPIAHGNRAILRERQERRQYQQQPHPAQYQQQYVPQQSPVPRTQPYQQQPVQQYDQLPHQGQAVSHQGRRKTHRHHEIPAEEAAYLRQLEAYDDRREAYKEAAQQQRDEYYRQYFDRMRVYAIQTHVKKYNQMIAQQAAEREKFQKTMSEFGVKEEDVIRQVGSEGVTAGGDNSKPPSPFGGAKSGNEVRGRARAVPNLIEPQRPSINEPRPENREVHRKAAAVEALCARFMPTVKKHCFEGNKTEEQYLKRCAAYFHDCQSFIPQPDPLYSIANSFSSNVGIGLGVGVKGIPYYPINEEGAVEVGRQINVPFGSWGGGYSDHFGVRDYWSQYQEAGANWYEGKYGYKSGWSVPLVQSLGIEGDTHAVVSVPVKPGELGKPIGVDVGGGVGPYYQQNQHVGVDYLNGQVGTNFGVGVPMAGVGVNTGLGISFPSVNDVIG